LVGPGRVGTSLARWLEAAGARLVAVAGRAQVAELATAGQDLLLLAVPDAALPELATLLAARPQARVALHTSGSLDASVLAPLRQRGTATGSFHPLMAFPRPLPDPAAARGKVFALDGDPEAQSVARRLTAAWDGIPVEVPAAARPLYHLSATLAAGGVVTLLSLAAELAARLDLPPATVQGYLELARGALAAAADAPDPAQALTGPAARGDLSTVHRHLEALSSLSPDRLPLVKALARETLRQCARLAPLTDSQQRLLEELGREESS
jgi:predicted short-subunit dehydrogenase-like oxidoreductase (DUF2520 family)